LRLASCASRLALALAPATLVRSRSGVKESCLRRGFDAATNALDPHGGGVVTLAFTAA
jgi:hypothetical protein